MIQLNFDKLNGLVPAVVQDHHSGEVLMVGFMNAQAWAATLESKRATFFSRSRQDLWVKGKTSGNVQIVNEILVDCDDDTVVLKVEQVGGAACHTGHRSCFHKKVVNNSIQITAKPVFDPRKVYGK